MRVNEVHNIDFLNNTLPDKCANLIIADPPYFEVKGSFDFVWKSFDDYLIDVEKWAKECKRLLADNGTLFWYGHAKKIAYSQIILDKYFNLENHIKWRKTDCQTRKGYENYRIFPPVTEHILMYSQEQYNLTQCVTHIRDYIRDEITKAKGKIVLKEVNEALGTATNGGGVASACLSLDKAEPTMLTKEMYEKLQEWCKPYLDKEYELLRAEYELLRAEYELLRRPFDNFMRMEDVWDFAQDVHITGNYDHPTKKTEKLSTLMIKSTTRKNDLVVVPFAGSGTECAMSAKEKRNFVGFEITPKHAEMSNKRVQKILKEPTLF
jgi:site-specific DNA-methyltransferase (adenine-specific)